MGYCEIGMGIVFISIGMYFFVNQDQKYLPEVEKYLPEVEKYLPDVEKWVDLKSVTIFLDKIPDDKIFVILNMTDKKKISIFEKACEIENIEIVKLILSKIPDEISDKNNLNIIHKCLGLGLLVIGYNTSNFGFTDNQLLITNLILDKIKKEDMFDFIKKINLYNYILDSENNFRYLCENGMEYSFKNNFCSIHLCKCNREKNNKLSQLILSKIPTDQNIDILEIMKVL